MWVCFTYFTSYCLALCSFQIGPQSLLLAIIWQSILECGPYVCGAIMLQFENCYVHKHEAISALIALCVAGDYFCKSRS